MSYRRFVGDKAIKLGSWGKDIPSHLFQRDFNVEAFFFVHKQKACLHYFANSLRGIDPMVQYLHGKSCCDLLWGRGLKINQLFDLKGLICV